MKSNRKTVSTALVTLVIATLFATLGAHAADNSGQKSVININTATAVELSFLPGVGPSKAQAIIKYRKAHPFKKIEHIMRVKGIGRKSFRKMQPWLAVDGATSVKKKIAAGK